MRVRIPFPKGDLPSETSERAGADVPAGLTGDANGRAHRATPAVIKRNTLWLALAQTLSRSTGVLAIALMLPPAFLFVWTGGMARVPDSSAPQPTAGGE